MVPGLHSDKILVFRLTQSKHVFKVFGKTAVVETFVYIVINACCFFLALLSCIQLIEAAHSKYVYTVSCIYSLLL